MAKVCSTTPFMQDKNPFFRVGLMMLLKFFKSLCQNFVKQFGDNRGKGNGVEVAGLIGVVFLGDQDDFRLVP